MSQITEPKVFISYSWSSPDHEAWVLDLAEQLMSDGVEVCLDKWDLREGQDKYAFMEQMVSDEEVSHVLLICDKQYKEKADARKGGVGDETVIVSPDVYQSAEQRKFLPIVAQRDEHGDAFVPNYLKSRIYIDLSEHDFGLEYEKLLRAIFHQPEYVKPEKGSPPAYLFDDDSARVQTHHSFSRARQAISKGTRAAQSATRNYLEDLENALREYVAETASVDGELWRKIDKQLEDLLPYQKQFVQFVELVLDFTHFTDEPFYFEHIHQFFAAGASIWAEEQPYSQKGDQVKFFLHEAFLHTTARLLDHGRIPELNFLLTERYFYQKQGRTADGMYDVFRQYVRSIEDDKNEALIRRKISLTATMFKSRCEENALVL